MIPQHRAGTAGLIVDLFAGGGGASLGIELALGRDVDVAVNHDPIALAVHAANHPRTRHLESSVWDVQPRAATGGAPVEILWASPDCTHFSAAKGDVPRSKGIRSLAWVVVRWARAVRPRVILLENVREFRTWGPLAADGRPCKRRAGSTFAAWVGALERLGYAVGSRILDAADYGAPTRRRRLFVVARRDGAPIAWPEPTHGPGRAPWRTAADCIDWSLPCPSIFERARPLAEKTQRRIAEGLRRYVFGTARPFLVQVNHGRDAWRGQGVDAPLSTVTATQRGHALVAPTLIQTGYGERVGQAPRVPGLEHPLGTVVAGGQKHALVAAWLVKHFGGVVGHELERPVGAVTARDHHSLAAATLVKLRGECHGADLREPAPTLTAGGTHVAEVRAFLASYCGRPRDAGLFDPGDRERLGLVAIEGVEYQLADIGMRMLEPHELLRAQFGEHAERYDLGAARTKSAKVRLIGNSVAPHVAAALVRANAERAVLGEVG